MQVSTAWLNRSLVNGPMIWIDPIYGGHDWFPVLSHALRQRDPDSIAKSRQYELAMASCDDGDRITCLPLDVRSVSFLCHRRLPRSLRNQHKLKAS